MGEIKTTSLNRIILLLIRQTTMAMEVKKGLLIGIGVVLLFIPQQCMQVMPTEFDD
jgi:hypothetical protein